MKQPVILNLAGAVPAQPQDLTPAGTPAPQPTTDREGNHPSGSKTPLFIPKQPPPKAVKRWDPSQTPPPGTWVKVVTKRDSYTGRLVFIEGNRMRLKEGAGYWDITVSEIIGLQQPADPRGKHKPEPRKAPDVTLVED